MTIKAPTKKPAQTRVVSPLYSISLATQIFATEFPLTNSYSIAYARFSPVSPIQQFQDVDSARKLVVDSGSSQPLLTSILSYTDVSKGSANLWIFHIDSDETPEEIRSLFKGLSFHGLLRSDTGSFAYNEIYPCSSTCSERRDPCTTCRAQQFHAQRRTEPSSQGSSPLAAQEASHPSTPLFSSYSTPNPTSLHSASCFLPRRPLRKPHNYFLNAIRERFVDDLCRSGSGFRRLRNGILMRFPESQTSWGDGWDHHQKLRPLMFCQIEVSLFSSAILIEPRLRSTRLLPLLGPPELIAGTPINLLPFFIPAYFLNHYTGSKSVLIRQFRSSLKGLGCGCWSSERRRTSDESGIQFIIAWMSVENKQGEEKGMMVVWPVDLCVTVISSPKPGSDSKTDNRYAYHRKQLTCIPELPTALQSSPVPAPATVSTQRGLSPNETKVVSAGPSSIDWITSPQNESSPLTPFQVHPPMQFKVNRPLLSRARSSFFVEMLYSHKTLASLWLRRQNVRRISTSVGKYVDSVAKERERERERMRKEREAAAAAGQTQKEQSTLLSAASSSAFVASVPLGSAPTPQFPPPRLAVENVIPPLATPSITVNLQPLTFPPSMQQLQLGTQPQAVPSYPSPPDEIMKPVPPGPLDEQPLPMPVPQPPDTDIDQRQVQATGDVEFSDAFELEKIMTDFNMDFTQDVNSAVAAAGQSTSAVDALRAMDLDLSIFTDDDFAFFDDQTTNPISLAVNQPSDQAQAAINTAVDSLGGLGIPAVFADNSHVSSLFSGVSLSTDVHPSPWSPSKLAEAFNTGASTFDTSFSAPELVPPSPDKSASSISGPTTPDVLCVIDVDAAQSSSSDDEPFNTLVFPDGIRRVDNKYKYGKFVVQLQARTMDVDSPVSISHYAVATDPRHAIVKKLADKRKKHPHDLANSSIRSPLYEDHSEWLSIADEESSEVSSTSEHESDDEGSHVDEEEGLTISRPSTPLPSILPPGPSLLATQFAHSALLPLSTALRSPGAPFSIPDLASPVPNPVPTPVSPAAILGVASEKSKSLEAAARTVCREAVANFAWLEAWRANTVDVVDALEERDNLVRVDFKEYLQKREVDLGTISIERLCDIASACDYAEDIVRDSPPATAYEPPNFSVGKNDAVITVSPSAISFWDKLGLSPRSGPKDIVAFIIFQGEDEVQEQMGDWLKRVSQCYSSKGFGKHVPGNARICGRDGLVPISFESIRKSITSLIESLDVGNASLLFYIVVPTSNLSLSSLPLRQILSALRRASSSHNEKRLHFHFLPETLFTRSDDIASTLPLDALTMSVYDRIARPTHRMITRTFGDGQDDASIAFFCAPAFTIARSPTPNVSISYKYPATDAGSLDRHTFLHVGYKFSLCRRWVLAACIDQRGEESDVGLWLVQDEHDWKHVVGRLWNFALEFTRRANVEWRIVFAKLGSMGEEELDAWNHQFSFDSFVDPSMHISVASIEEDAGWIFISSPHPSHPSSVSSTPTKSLPHSSHNVDSSSRQLISSAYRVFTLPCLLRLPLRSSFDIDVYASKDFIPDEGEDSSSEIVAGHEDEGRLRPLQTGVLIIVSPYSNSNQAKAAARSSYIHLLGTYSSPSSTLTKTDEQHHKELLHNYHDLTVLTQARWGRHDCKPTLPFHLASLRIMDEVLIQNNNNSLVIDVS